MDFKIEKIQKIIIEDEGYIFSVDTLNNQHLLAKTYNLLSQYGLNEDLQKKIVGVFTFKHDDDSFFSDEDEIDLWYLQYYNQAYITDEKQYEADEIWNEDIFNYLNEISPSGYYFGSSDGDGSCFGWFKYE